MSSTLYRKYRPQEFSEIIGQQHIVQTLSNSIKNNRIGQAYLFTGPRGTGKTTIARVFAKAVSCQKRAGFEPCQKCEICRNINEGKSLDIIEIDAASNTGVDNIRELRETVKLPPTQSKYKVYIIDEVHMLSTGAFNALLKTLEEPPAHVIFILATTEIHKVPETIISRCQRFDFSKLTLEQLIKKMQSIAKSEKVEIEKDALEMIAIAAEGGMRDAESILSQIIALEDKKITSKEVGEILGTARHKSVEALTSHILNNETSKALELVNKLSEEGMNFEVFGKSLLNYLRKLMIISVSLDLTSLFSLELSKEQMENAKKLAKSNSTRKIISVLENLIEAQREIRSSFIPSLPIEMAIIKSTIPEKASIAENENPKKTKGDTLQEDISSSNPYSDEKTSVEKPKKEKNEEDDGPEQNIHTDLEIEMVEGKWKEIVEATRPYNHSLIAFLSNCKPAKIEGGSIVIATKYNLYKDKLNEKKNRTVVEDVIAKILNSRASVRFVTEEEAGVKIKTQSEPESQPSKNSESASLLDEAMKLMGGKIVEE